MAKLPAVIGRYQILDRIGQGGMGSLFLAWDPMLERQIAIKLLRDDNEELRERFAREARSVAKLRHRNIVTIFDVGEQDGQPFIAMEFIQGQTMGDLIRSGAAVHVVRKLQLVDELCDGLGFAHRSGIVHRDIKPANVMVEHEGAVKILDFGIARIAESGMTQAGMLIGTLNYMSPEQVAGRVVDMRSDIFAVGAVLYELLACKQAFPGGLHNGILNRILHEAAPPLEDFCPDLDAEVIQIVEQALEKDPQERYQDLSAMRKDLQRAQQRLESSPAETIALRPAEPPETVSIDGPTMPPRKAQTPRRGTDREGLARRRASQIAAHLEQAHQALAAEDFEGAIAAAEQALMLDAEEADAIELLDRARVGLEERQVQELLSRGEELLRDGALTKAMGLAEQALTLTPGSAVVLRFREQIDKAKESRARERERAEAIAHAIKRARTLLNGSDFEQAEAAAEEALKLDPDLAEARALQDQAREARAKRDREALDRRASAAVQEADRLFQNGRPGDAIAALEGFAPAHEKVTAALTSLRQVLERIDRERREAQERADRIAAAIATAAKTGPHDQAIAILDDALKLDPAHAELKSLLSRRRAARDEELRLAKERSEKIAKTLAQAKTAPSHERAIEALQAVLALEAGHPEAARLLAERQSALAKEREAARKAKERAQAVAAAVEEARGTSSHEAAIGILRQAMAIDSDLSAVRKLLAEREAALERERTAALAARERAEKISAARASAKQTAGHAAAIRILEDALKLDPAHAELKALLADRRAARDEQERQARERRDKIAAAVASAQKAASHEAAIQALEGALAIDPSDAEVRRLLTDRQTVLAQEREAARQAKEREQAIAAALSEAKAAASHEAAIGILRRALAIDKNHAAVRDQLAAREAAFEREQAEARKARELAEKIAAAVATSRRTAAHDSALGILEDALKLDPANAEIKALIAERRTARDEEARQARERREKANALIAKAKGLASHEAAIAALESAVALEPADVEIKRLLGDRHAALAREKEAARLAKEREEAVASAIARAAKTDSHEAAVEILEGALKLESGNVQLQKLAGERRVARDGQREDERKAAERREKVANAIKKAKAATSHESAVALLKDALALDPENRDAHALHESRSASLEKERAEAKRAKDIETARQTIVGLIGKQQFDAADAALQNAEATLHVGKTFKDLKKQLANARSAASVPAGIATIDRPGLNLGSPAMLGSIAALVLAVVAGVYFMTQSGAPQPATPIGTDAARVERPAAPAQPQAQQQQPPTTSSPPPSTPTPSPEVQPSPTSTPPSQPESTTATPPPAAPEPSTPVPNPAVVSAVQQGRQLLRSDPKRAMTAVTSGLKIEPQNKDLQGILGEIVKRSRQDAATARTNVLRHGQAAVDANATFRDATTKLSDAARAERSRPEAAPGLYWQAADLLGRADREVTDTLSKAAAAPAATKATPTPEPKPPVPTMPTNPQTTPPGTSVPPPPAPPPVSSPPAATNPNPTSPGRGTAAPPKPQEDDEALIRQMLRAYQEAYTTLSVEAVRRVFPSVDAGGLAGRFNELRSQDVQIDSERITINGNTATVTCRVRTSARPKQGRATPNTANATFVLEKQGGRWIIRERR